jgi:uncharacterized OB-fold protein
MTEQAKPKPRPDVSETTRPFWDAVADDTLKVQFDPATGAAQFYPRSTSLATGRGDLEWRAVSGRGTVYSFTVTHVPIPGFEDEVPYVIAMIDLEEGVRILANMTGVTEDAMEIGLPVRVAFEQRTDDVRYFRFEPDP